MWKRSNTGWRFSREITNGGRASTRGESGEPVEVAQRWVGGSGGTPGSLAYLSLSVKNIVPQRWMRFDGADRRKTVERYLEIHSSNLPDSLSRQPCLFSRRPLPSLPQCFPPSRRLVAFRRARSLRSFFHFLFSFFFSESISPESRRNSSLRLLFTRSLKSDGHDLADRSRRFYSAPGSRKRILERHSTGERATMTLIVRPRTMVSAGVTKIDTSWPANFRTRGAIVGKRARVNYPGGLHNRFFDFAPAPSLAKLVTSWFFGG